MASRVCISPSILAADPLCFEDQIRLAIEGGAEYIHMDIMDGRFVPNITMGPFFVEAFSKVVHAHGAQVDVHLMIEEPERFIPAFASAGADIITIHIEAARDLVGTLKGIRTQGARAGLTLRPKTPLIALQTGLAQADVLLVMSVEPGYGGQKFMPESLARIRRIKEMLTAIQSKAEIEVDGGIGVENAADITAAGADILVAGVTVFKAGIPIPDAVRGLRQAALGNP
jgi:ribulose-phosphate 3-epimerase